MLVHMLKSKLHRARITDANLDYEGSLTIDRELMDRACLLPYEKVLCTNATNGSRFETYAIPGERGLGDIVLNGAAAHLGKPGDRLTIMSFTELDTKDALVWKPRVLLLTDENRVTEGTGAPKPPQSGSASRSARRRKTEGISAS